MLRESYENNCISQGISGRSLVKCNGRAAKSKVSLRNSITFWTVWPGESSENRCISQNISGGSPVNCNGLATESKLQLGLLRRSITFSRVLLRGFYEQVCISHSMSGTSVVKHTCFATESTGSLTVASPFEGHVQGSRMKTNAFHKASLADPLWDAIILQRNPKEVLGFPSRF